MSCGTSATTGADVFAAVVSVAIPFTWEAFTPRGEAEARLPLTGEGDGSIATPTRVLLLFDKGDAMDVRCCGTLTCRRGALWCDACSFITDSATARLLLSLW